MSFTFLEYSIFAFELRILHSYHVVNCVVATGVCCSDSHSCGRSVLSHVQLAYGHRLSWGSDTEHFYDAMGGLNLDLCMFYHTMGTFDGPLLQRCAELRYDMLAVVLVMLYFYLCYIFFTYTHCIYIYTLCIHIYIYIYM